MMATAEQTVSAVLEDTTKSYLVESGTTNGIWWRRYSDGYIVQGGTTNRTTGQQISFAIEFPSNNYLITAVSASGEGTPRIGEHDSTGFTFGPAGAACSMQWVAQGY